MPVYSRRQPIDSRGVVGRPCRVEARGRAAERDPAHMTLLADREAPRTSASFGLAGSKRSDVELWRGAVRLDQRRLGPDRDDVTALTDGKGRF